MNEPKFTKGPCKYCDKAGQTNESITDDCLDAIICGNELNLSYSAYSVDSSFEFEVQINYCPMCGRLLKAPGES